MHSKLSDHKFKKGKFVTPWNELMNGLMQENSWYRGRLPEYLWLALIIEHYGRENGLVKCISIFSKLREQVPDLSTPKFSKILKLDSNKQNELYDYIINVIDVNTLTPLTTIFTYSSFPSFASKFQTELTIKGKIGKINSVMRKTSDHQSHLSTDIRFLVIYFNLLSGKLQMPRETLDLLLEYPKLSHDDGKMRMIRPMVRATEIAPSEIDLYDADYLDVFWEGVSRMSDCELFCIDFMGDSPNTEDYMKYVKTVMQYYTDLLVSVNPLDNKMLVLLGIATYSYKRLLELVNHDLFYAISGRSIVRILIEDYIMMKYLLQNESAHDDIWTEYQYYGIGQYKLIVERYKQSGKTLTDSHAVYDYMDMLVNEYKDKEFIDMDTTYFDKQNIRGKAISVDEKELFDFFYDYDSAFEHGLWGAIRESSLIKCDSPSHQYHCIPDIEDKQKMKNVWNDCVEIMNKTLTILEGVYGLPSHFSREAEKDGN